MRNARRLLAICLFLGALAGCKKTSGGTDAEGAVDVGAPADGGRDSTIDARQDGAVDAAPDASRDSEVGPRDGGLDADASAGDADVGPRDVGFYDAGPCGCSFGFHRECPAGEQCGGGIVRPAGGPSGPGICVPAEPRGGTMYGGCSMIAGTAGAPCNAQCVPEAVGSPCGREPRGNVENTIGQWNYAVDEGSKPELTPDERRQRWLARLQVIRTADPNPECTELVGWTVLGLLELCRGEGLMMPPASGWFPIDDWTFLPPDECRNAAGWNCVLTVANAVSSGRLELYDFPQPALALCPNGAPFAAPCNGADAVNCIQERVRSIIRILLTPSQ